MNLTFYKTVDSDNVINKTLTDPLVMTINLRRDVNLNTPELLIEGDVRGYNYADLLDRKYFVRDVISINETVFKVRLECDVLETYKSSILAATCKYQTSLESGDYGDTEFGFTGRETVSEFLSDVTLTESCNTVLTVNRW